LALNFSAGAAQFPSSPTGVTLQNPKTQSFVHMNNGHGNAEPGWGVAQYRV